MRTSRNAIVPPFARFTFRITYGWGSQEWVIFMGPVPSRAAPADDSIDMALIIWKCGRYRRTVPNSDCQLIGPTLVPIPVSSRGQNT